MRLDEIVETGRVICGFPGVGKSSLVKKLSGEKIKDSDSSKFDKKNFPDNYIKHIKKHIMEGYTILASSHDVVRKALIDEGIGFTLVFPDKKCKDEYIKRYKERGNDEKFIKLLEENFEKWVDECENEKSSLVKKVKLGCDEYIESVF